MPDTGQSIVLGQESEERFFTSPDCGKCGVDAGCFPCYFKSLAFQIICQAFGRKSLLICKFRVMENVIGSMYKFFLMIVEPAGNDIVRCMFSC